MSTNTSAAKTRAQRQEAYNIASEKWAAAVLHAQFCARAAEEWRRTAARQQALVDTLGAQADALWAECMGEGQ